MITFENINELAKYIKVNADFEIESISPFYGTANEMLGRFTGVAVENLPADECLKDAFKRYVAVASLFVSKGMQNVKLTNSGFTRYSEFAKNVIAASSDAMKLFSDDLSAYLDYCEEAVLGELERVKPAGWETSIYSTLLDLPIKTVDDVLKYSGVAIRRKQFRSSRVVLSTAVFNVAQLLGDTVMGKVITSTSDITTTANRIYLQYLAEVAHPAGSGFKPDDTLLLLEKIVLRYPGEFGQEAFAGGAIEMDGGIGL